MCDNCARKCLESLRYEGDLPMAPRSAGKNAESSDKVGVICRALRRAIIEQALEPGAPAPRSEKPDAAKGTKRFSPLLEGQPERDDGIRPLVRGKTGVGSYEDPGEQRRKGRTKNKTGRPGR